MRARAMHDLFHEFIVKKTVALCSFSILAFIFAGQ